MESKIKEYLSNGGKNSPKAVQALYDKIASHPDVFDEFLYWFENKKFKQNNPITIDGYTAQNLFENFNLREIGAFAMLVSLRTNHDQMIECLKTGLPVM